MSIVFKGPVHFWEVDAMCKIFAKFGAFFPFTVLLENLTVKSYEQKKLRKKISNEFEH
jgi:hypothetical protein